MFSTISSFQMIETSTPLFTNPSVSLFPNDLLVDESSSSLSQSMALPAKSPLTVEPTDPSSISPPPPLRRTSRLSQPSVIFRDYVCNSTIVTYEPRTYREASSNPLWQKAMGKALYSNHINTFLFPLPIRLQKLIYVVTIRS